ncbi:MAG: HAD-IIIA family hydrolase [Candidatus Zixiibacteriota bacterium]|nr:MAG: HAD-IIIA family hydrolase [candidate division Zixibacteria bacterium]
MSTKLLVIRLGSLGDVILTSATVLNLKLNWPDSELVYLTRENFAEVVRHFDGVDRIETVPDNPGPKEYIRRLYGLDNMNFDIVVDLHGNGRSWLARKMITAGRSVVYPKRRWERRRLVRNKTIPAAWPHTIDMYNDCLRQLDGRSFCTRPLMKSTQTGDRRSRPSDSEPLVIVAPGAAHPNKKWFTERFEGVAARLHNELGAMICWVIGSDGSGSTDAPASVPESAVKIMQDRTIPELADLISEADLTIANDSGLAHLSSAVGTPVLSIFGPTHPALGFAPRGIRDAVIEVDEYCRPCSLHGRKPCFREERFCFSRINADQVIEAAAGILSRGRGDPALLLDRDGTVIVNKHFLADPDLVELEEGAAGALRKASSAGYKLVIVSNQSGVARGYFGTDAVDQVNTRMLELLAAERVTIDGLYYCPHHSIKGTVSEYTVDCDCRKPSAGMAEQAVSELNIDLRRSYVIGDSRPDFDLGRVIGARSILLRTGHGPKAEVEMQVGCKLTDECVFDNLSAAIDFIVRRGRLA